MASSRAAQGREGPKVGGVRGNDAGHSVSEASAHEPKAFCSPGPGNWEERQALGACEKVLVIKMQEENHYFYLHGSHFQPSLHSEGCRDGSPCL